MFHITDSDISFIKFFLQRGSGKGRKKTKGEELPLYELSRESRIIAEMCLSLEDFNHSKLLHPTSSQCCLDLSSSEVLVSVSTLCWQCNGRRQAVNWETFPFMLLAIAEMS